MVRRVTVDKLTEGMRRVSCHFAGLRVRWKAILMTDVASLFPRDALATVRSVLERHAGEPGALLPILHDVQDALGYIPRRRGAGDREGLNLSRAEVHGVITYYHHFRSEPAGTHVVQVCRAESCQAVGADALMAHAETVLGCASHHTRADGAVTLEPVYCLGMCASSPAIMVGEKLYARDDAGEVRSRRGIAAASTEHELLTESTCRAIRRRWPSAPTKSLRALQAECARRGIDARYWCATVRAACSGSSRWSRCDTPTGPRRIWPGDARRCAGAARCRLARRRRACAVPGADRSDSVSRRSSSA